MTTPPGSGLVSYRRNGSRNYLPLASVSANVHIVDVSARVILTQLFISDHNSDSSPRAQYIFPVPANGAVCAFKMLASSGQAVTGIVMERSKAKKEYEIAISNDKWAGLLYETTPDVFVITIGAIPRRQNIEVTITYVVELSDGDLHDQVEFILPTYIAQRYGPAPSELTAPSSSSGNTIFNITAEIQMTSKILSVTSPSHLIKVKTRNDDDPNNSKYRSTVKLAREARPGRLDSDFALVIQAVGLGKARCVAEQRVSERTVALSLTLVPQFRLEHLPRQEYVFLIDRSGSMGGSTGRIGQAKQALIILLQSLPAAGTFFNIFSFGSSCSSLWPSSQPYTSSALTIARQHVDGMDADMGRTETKMGLEKALASQMRSIPTSLFLLTDGEVWKIEEIFSLVDRHVIEAGNTANGTYLRIFTLGIGDAASTALCEGVARRGNGLCLMTSHSSDISQKVSKLFLASRVSPLGNVENLEIDWGCRPAESDSARTGVNDKGTITHRVSQSPNPLGSANTQFHITLPDPPKIQQAPTRVPNLYPNNRFTVSVILSDTTEVPETVTLRGTFPDGSQITIPLTVAAHEADDEDLPPLIHTLAAHRLILELEDGDPSSQGSFDATDKRLHDAVIEAAVVRFSETYQLASQFASFIAIYEAQDGHSDSDSETDSDDSLDGRSEHSDVSQISDEGAQRQSGEFGSTAGPRNPQNDSDQEGSDSDDNSSRARRGDGADPLSASDDDDGDFSSISSLSSHSLTRSQGDKFPFRILKYLRSIWRKASRPKPPMRREVDMPGAWLEPERTVVVTPACPKPRKKAMATVTSEARASVITAAGLQEFDGSFILDERLCSLIGDKLSLLEVKSAIPSALQGVQDADKIWATVLVTAYMKAHLGGDRDIWLGLWKKAEGFITSVLGDKLSFASLVEEASKLLV